MQSQRSILLNEEAASAFKKLEAKLDELKEHQNHEHASPQPEEPQKDDHQSPSSHKFHGCCGGENPNFDENQVQCDDCLEKIGSESEIKEGKINNCWNCGTKIDA